MDVSQILEKHPQLEEVCRSQISVIYRDLMGHEPITEVQEYIY
jgi:hypothetical protein